MKKRNKPAQAHPISKLPLEDAKLILGEVYAQSVLAQTKIQEIETPFGLIRMGEGALMERIRNKTLLFDLSAVKQSSPEDVLEELIQLEKLLVSYPQEPILLREIAEHYKRLKEREKHDKVVRQNYEKHRGYPLIDMDYAALIQHEKGRDDIVQEVFGTALNLHEVYPGILTFDIEEVDTFYSLQALAFINLKSFEKAEQCLRVVETIDGKGGAYIKTSLIFKRHPWKRWVGRLILLLLALLVVGIVGGVLWGIVRLVQWVF